MGERDIIDKLAKLFRKYKVNYLLTGSYAVSYWGRPRATHDIDFIVETKASELSAILNVVKGLGKDFDFDKSQIELAVKDRWQFNVFHDETGIKIDFWVVKDDDFERKKFQRKVTTKVFDEKISIISAEDLILTKLLWNKQISSERHLRDCVGIWQVQKGRLDLAHLKSWAKKLGVVELLQNVASAPY